LIRAKQKNPPSVADNSLQLRPAWDVAGLGHRQECLCLLRTQGTYPKRQIGSLRYNYACRLAYRIEPMMPLQPTAPKKATISRSTFQLRDQLRALVPLRASSRMAIGNPASRELATANRPFIATTVAKRLCRTRIEGLIQKGPKWGAPTYIVASEVRHFHSGYATPRATGGGMRWNPLFADERGKKAETPSCRKVPPTRCFLSQRGLRRNFPVEGIPPLAAIQC